jgi:hypothetical protein
LIKRALNLVKTRPMIAASQVLVKGMKNVCAIEWRMHARTSSLAFVQKNHRVPERAPTPSAPMGILERIQDAFAGLTGVWRSK